MVDAALKVHLALGPGLYESVYAVVLAYELKKRGLAVEREVPILIRYEQIVFEEGFRADLIIENLVIVERKSIEEIMPIHKKQLLTYLKLADKRLGLLINFGENYIKDGIHRVANGLQE